MIRLNTLDGANIAGLAKVIPPPEWSHRIQYSDVIGNIVMESPIDQEYTPKKSDGIFETNNSMYRAKMKVFELKQLSETEEYAMPILEDDEAYDTAYWQNLNDSKPIYGADVDKSLTSQSVTEW